MSLEITEIFSIAGLSGVISGLSIVIATYFFDLKKLKTTH